MNPCLIDKSHLDVAIGDLEVTIEFVSFGLGSIARFFALCLNAILLKPIFSIGLIASILPFSEFALLNHFLMIFRRKTWNPFSRISRKFKR